MSDDQNLELTQSEATKAKEAAAAAKTEANKAETERDNAKKAGPGVDVDEIAKRARAQAKLSRIKADEAYMAARASRDASKKITDPKRNAAASTIAEKAEQDAKTASADAGRAKEAADEASDIADTANG